GMKPNHGLVDRRIAVRLHDGVGAAARQRRSNLVEIRSPIESNDDDRPAGELDAFRHPVLPDERYAGKDDQPRQRDGVPLPPDEIEVRVLEYMHINIPRGPRGPRPWSAWSVALDT